MRDRQGGIIGATVTPTETAASGIWSLREAERFQRAGTWPLPPFPKTISGLQLWLDASDSSTLYDATSGGSLVAADGPVARWEDKSENQRHATQETSTRRPLRRTAHRNGRDAIELDGSNDQFVLSMSLAASNWTVFFACDPATANNTAGGVGRYLLDAETGRLVLAQHDGINFNDVGVVASGGWTEVASSTADPQVLAFSLNSSATSAKVFRNGTQIGSAYAYTQTALGGSIGLFGSYDPGGVADGVMYEVLLYDSALSDTDRESVEAYLMSKWGIS